MKIPVNKCVDQIFKCRQDDFVYKRNRDDILLTPPVEKYDLDYLTIFLKLLMITKLSNYV